MIAGTFGKLLDNEGTFDTLLGSANVTVSLQCGMRQLYFNQCICECCGRQQTVPMYACFEYPCTVQCPLS